MRTSEPLIATRPPGWAWPAPTRHVLGFGLALVDFDGDGRTDLIQANGHVLDRARLGIPFAMRPTLLRNTGAGFHEVTRGAGPWFDRPMLGRGLAVGDLDGDGRPDVVVNSLDAPAALLQNASDGNHFLVAEIINLAGRPAVGARVEVTAGGHRQVALLGPAAATLRRPNHDCFSAWAQGNRSTSRRDLAVGGHGILSEPAIPVRGPLQLKQGTGRAKL